MGIGYIGRALKPLENLETDLRMCLAHMRPPWGWVHGAEGTSPTGLLWFSLGPASGWWAHGPSSHGNHFPSVRSCHLPSSVFERSLVRIPCQMGPSEYQVFCFGFTISAFRKEASPWFHNSGIFYIIYPLIVPWTLYPETVTRHKLTLTWKLNVNCVCIFSFCSAIQRSKVFFSFSFF